jgi:hypothetical protein
VYPPTHKAYWNAADAYLMGNVTPGGVYTHTHTHTHTNIHCLPYGQRHAWRCTRMHTHTHTRPPSPLSLSLSLSVSLTVTDSLSLTHTQTHTVTRTLSRSHSFSLSDGDTHSLTRSLTLSHTVTDMRAIIQSQESGSPGGGLACVDLLNRMWDCRTKRRVTAKQVSNCVCVCVCVCVYVL